MKLIIGTCGIVLGLTTFTLAFGSVPQTSRITDDTAIYQKLSQIQLPKEKPINFDSDIDRLTSIEGRYREKLPSLSRASRVAAPMQRITKQQYRYTGNKAQTNKNSVAQQ